MRNLRVPYLQEAKCVGGLSVVVAHNRCLADSGRKGRAFAKRTVLNSGGEERRGLNFLPKIEARNV